MAAWQAWHAAALPLQKRFPSLSQLLGDEEKPVFQTNDQFLARMRMLARKVPGMEIRRVA